MSHIYNELKPPYKKTGISNRRITMKVYMKKGIRGHDVIAK